MQAIPVQATGRLTVKVEAYHQLLSARGNPTGPSPVRWQPPVFQEGPDAQLWMREMVVGPEPVKLDRGWVERASLVLLQNLEGQDGRTIPTKEQVEAVQSRVVEVGQDGLLPPGAPYLAVPRNLEQLTLRCRSGKARVLVVVYPA